MDRNNIIVSVLIIALIIIGLVVYRRQNSIEIPTTAPTPIIPTPTETTTPTINPSIVPAIAVDLAPVDSSLYNQAGTAILTQRNNQVVVTVTINQPSGVDNNQPININTGTCTNIGKIIFQLNNIVEGKSTTTLNTTLNRIENQKPLVISINRSNADTNIYTACGSL